MKTAAGLAATATNTFGRAGLISRRLGSTSTFYTFDAQGNVAQRYTSTGSLVSSDLYDAFGKGTSTGGGDVFGYEGQAGYYTDTTTGLILCGHRFYDSAGGRFVNRDPIGYAGGINLYGYVGNNASNGVDPSGFGRPEIDMPDIGDGGGGGGEIADPNAPMPSDVVPASVGGSEPATTSCPVGDAAEGGGGEGGGTGGGGSGASPGPWGDGGLPSVPPADAPIPDKFSFNNPSDYGPKTTVIGRMNDTLPYKGMDGMDSWWDSGKRLPNGDLDPNVSLDENREWIYGRMQRGDNFALTTPESQLGKYIEGQPNGSFTAEELKWLRQGGIEPYHAY